MAEAEANKAQAERYNAVVARAWTEPDYRARLLAEPAKVLGEAGIDVPGGKSLRVVEVGKDEVYLVLPAQMDPESRARVRQEPASVLAQAGLAPAAGRSVQVLEEDETNGYVLIPSRPADMETGSQEVQGYMNIASLNQIALGGGLNLLMGGQSGPGNNMLKANQASLFGGTNIGIFTQSTT